jgi:hypothetical protein
MPAERRQRIDDVLEQCQPRVAVVRREPDNISKLSIANVVKAATDVITHQSLIVSPGIHPDEFPAQA